MSTQPSKTPSPAASTAARVPPAVGGRLEIEGLTGITSLDDPTGTKIDQIEMIGEEEAAGLTPHGSSDVTPGMRYLHCSRTIHQLVTDRNRAVGIYLAVAPLLWTGSSALLNVKPSDNYKYDRLMVPLEVIHRWCLPATFATLCVLALFVGFLLIRTRVGLIYEVAKMNALLGLPVGRVKRVNPLSIFFIMHALISLAGGCSGALFTGFLLSRAGLTRREILTDSTVVGLGITLLLVFLYIGTVLVTTADHKLGNVKN